MNPFPLREAPVITQEDLLLKQRRRNKEEVIHIITLLIGRVLVETVTITATTVLEAGSVEVHMMEVRAVMEVGEDLVVVAEVMEEEEGEEVVVTEEAVEAKRNETITVCDIIKTLMEKCHKNIYQRPKQNMYDANET